MWHSKILNDVLLAGKSCLVACVPRMSSASHYAWNISICQVVIMILNQPDASLEIWQKSIASPITLLQMRLWIYSTELVIAD